MSKKLKYIAVAGPTASGKSSMALGLAQKLDGEIINCDSIQVYRGFNIGAAKPSLEEQSIVPHHMFDVVNGNDEFDAALYARQAKAVLESVISRGRVPIVVGGTGLYFRALWGDSFHSLPKNDELRVKLAKISNEALYAELKFIDPQRASEIHINDRFRLIRAVELIRLLKGPISARNLGNKSEDSCFKIKMELDRPLLHSRIAERTGLMINEGLIKEVKSLLDQGVHTDSKPMQSIGYKQVLDYLNGLYSDDQLKEKIVVATRQYAKRQETWFKKVEFDHYSNTKDLEQILSKARAYLKS